MLKSKLITILAFVVIFAAGASVGMVRHTQINPKKHHGPFDELNLSEAQDTQIRKIWDDVRKGRPSPAQWEQIDHERDARIAALLTPEQKSQYDQIQRDHDLQREALHKQMESLIHEAEGKTRAVLTPEQQTKFDELRKQRSNHRPPFRGSRRGAETQPAT